MPHALDILRSSAFRASRQPAIEPGYEEFMPSEDELQEEQISSLGKTLGESGGSYGYIPSRESVGQSAYHKLRRAMGLQAIQRQGELEKASLVPRIQGEYQLAGERIKGQTAQANLQAQREAAAAREAGAMERAQLAQTGATTRARESELGRGKRSGLREMMLSQRARTANVGKQTQDILSGKAKVPSAGIWDWLTGGGKARQAAVTALQQQEQTTTDADLAQFAQFAQDQAPGISLDDALSTFGETVTPEEYSALSQMWSQ